MLFQFIIVETMLFQLILVETMCYFSWVMPLCIIINAHTDVLVWQKQSTVLECRALLIYHRRALICKIELLTFFVKIKSIEYPTCARGTKKYKYSHCYSCVISSQWAILC